MNLNQGRIMQHRIWYTNPGSQILSRDADEITKEDFCQVQFRKILTVRWN